MTSDGPRERLPIVILISGRGSNMRAIAELAARGELPVDIKAVISDKADAGGLAVAESMNIPTATLSPQQFAGRDAYDAALVRLVASHAPRLIVLAGFMRILTRGFVEKFTGMILNIHPSLLPNYTGLHTHRRVLAAGESMHGVSVHFVTEELDGGPVIIQACIRIQPGDTENSLSARVQRQEHTIYPQAIEWFAQGRLALREDRAWLDGKPLASPVVVYEPQ
jgi:phosphoribosylglycinamide formyltransferase 1